jgi:hypothetical protein
MQLASCLGMSQADLPSNKEVSFLRLQKIDPFISSTWEKTICEIHPPNKPPLARGMTRINKDEILRYVSQFYGGGGRLKT